MSANERLTADALARIELVAERQWLDGMDLNTAKRQALEDHLDYEARRVLRDGHQVGLSNGEFAHAQCQDC